MTTTIGVQIITCGGQLIIVGVVYRLDLEEIGMSTIIIGEGVINGIGTTIAGVEGVVLVGVWIMTGVVVDFDGINQSFKIMVMTHMIMIHTLMITLIHRTVVDLKAFVIYPTTIITAGNEDMQINVHLVVELGPILMATMAVRDFVVVML